MGQNEAINPQIGCTMAQYGVHIGWNYDPRDYNCVSKSNGHEESDAGFKNAVACIVNNTMRLIGEHPEGGIILLHSVYRATYRAVQQLVPQLRDKGYAFYNVEDYVVALYQKKSDALVPATPGAPSAECLDYIKKNPKIHGRLP
jgi:peptidoglycan/xylan/chitin deacetylase (PgdA/CDA1 family)